jgi:hypothetical protein
VAFASTADVAKRRGRPLEGSDEDTAAYLLEAAQSVIEEVVERDEAAIVAEKGGVPTILKFIAVEKVLRAMANPQGLASQSETLGAHSHTERFNSGGSTDLLLSEVEERLARKAVYGQLSGTARTKSLASEI